MGTRNRNTALMFITAGLFLLLGNMIGFFTVIALFIIWLGVHKVRTGEDKTGYILLAIGALFLASGNFGLVLAVILLSLGYFIIRSKQFHKDDNYSQKHSVLESIRWNKEPWVLENSSIWSVVGEINLDLSLAIADEAETTLVFQGVIGDIDILVSEDIGVAVQSSILIGQTITTTRREAGLMNKLNWKSDNYDTSPQKVNLMVSYIIGDLNIKML